MKKKKTEIVEIIFYDIRKYGLKGKKFLLKKY